MKKIKFITLCAVIFGVTQNYCSELDFKTTLINNLNNPDNYELQDDQETQSVDSEYKEKEEQHDKGIFYRLMNKYPDVWLWKEYPELLNIESQTLKNLSLKLYVKDLVSKFEYIDDPENEEFKKRIKNTPTNWSLASCKNILPSLNVDGDKSVTIGQLIFTSDHNPMVKIRFNVDCSKFFIIYKENQKTYDSSTSYILESGIGILSYTPSYYLVLYDTPTGKMLDWFPNIIDASFSNDNTTLYMFNNDKSNGDLLFSALDTNNLSYATSYFTNKDSGLRVELELFLIGKYSELYGKDAFGYHENPNAIDPIFYEYYNKLFITNYPSIPCCQVIIYSSPLFNDLNNDQKIFIKLCDIYLRKNNVDKIKSITDLSKFYHGLDKNIFRRIYSSFNTEQQKILKAAFGI